MSYYNDRPGFLDRLFANVSPAVKNLIIINAIMLLATYIIGRTPMYKALALFSFGSPFFKPWQMVTHMFMHGGFWHFFFNMYTLAVFGTVLENIWGSRKFLVFYFVTGLGAALCHNLVLHLQISQLMAGGSAQAAFSLMNVPTLGASGAIYGVLLGFAMLYPDAQLRLLFLPFFPLKAKWLAVAFGVIELLTGIGASGDGIAHFAHLGGMLFAWLLIRIWRKGNRLYS